VPGEDKDLDLTFLVRLVPSQKRMAIHRFQHIYVFVIYAVSTLIWVFLKDYLLFFGKKYNLRQKKEFLPELAKMVFFKFVYYGIYLAIPLFVLSLPVWQIVLAFVLMHVFEGLALALMFSLAHLVEEATFPVPDEKGRIENIWAIHQLQTTANFCIDNPLINFFTGGLNFQVEHHLFSHICHIHYRPLSDIVRQTAKEYHVPYRTKDSLVEAMGSHIGLLKRMGREDAPVFATPSLN
jgi:linoleoyl-CoA desaturase